MAYDAEGKASASHGGVTRITTASGRSVEIGKITLDDVALMDVAKSLSNIRRFNGYTPFPVTVAQHCMIMAALAKPEYKMEALLHDAGEAYTGDLLPQIKNLYPELVELEYRVGGVVFTKLHPKFPLSETLPDTFGYIKSPYIEALDRQMALWEMRSTGLAPIKSKYPANLEPAGGYEAYEFQKHVLDSLIGDSSYAIARMYIRAYNHLYTEFYGHESKDNPNGS